MTESPDSAEAQKIVDDLEEEIVDVDKAAGDQKKHDAAAEDVTDEVPDAPEPAD